MNSDNQPDDSNKPQQQPDVQEQKPLQLNQVNQTFGTQQFQVPIKAPEQVFAVEPATYRKQHKYSAISNMNDDNVSQSSQKSANEKVRRKSSYISQSAEDAIVIEQERINQRKKQDARSVFLENVDYKATKEELQLLFEDCDKIEKITILKNNFNGQPKGCAYISFESEKGVERALFLSGISLRNRNVKVHRKRTNLPGVKKQKPRGGDMNIFEMMQSYSRGGMRGGRGRGRGRGGWRGS